MGINQQEKHRKLTPLEISTLLSHGCVAQNWDDIEVCEEFICDNILNVTFSSHVRLGLYNSTIKDSYGVERQCGVRNVHIINSTIGDNSLIENIGGYIANYDVADGVIVEGCGRIVCRGKSSFGNGVEVRTINEGGGREVPIYRDLSAQIAYLIAMYRHRPIMVERITKLIEIETEALTCERGTIMSGARVSNCGSIIDTYIEAQAVVDGAQRLSNGWIGGASYVGNGVCAEDFIVARGAVVDSGATLTRCFIGEGSVVDGGFTAVDSLLFANCQMAAGEAVSIFAAPYTVSHHRSSLLIAGYFSFFNAGSGSNQSNHLFKTGPLHQGIHERGCKFASNAYIMLPAREGAFTMVLGRHTSHHDTELLPYSYLIEQDGRSYLHPGANLQSYGTERDLRKWAQRDRRLDGVGVDRIHFDEYNPYIGERLIKAISLCEQMLAREEIETHSYMGVRIKRGMLERGVRLYRLALDALIGGILAGSGEAVEETSAQWVDMAGMFAPKRELDILIKEIEVGEFDSIEQLEHAVDTLYISYHNHAYGWAYKQLVGGTNIEHVIQRGVQAEATLKKMRAEDALRDNEKAMRVGYGVDAGGDMEEIEADFRQVRGLKE